MKKLFKKIDGKSSKDRVLIVDADIYLYQAVTDCQEEQRTSDDEYIYTLDAKLVQSALKLRIKSDMVALEASLVCLCFGSADNWRKKLLPEYKAHRSLKKPLGYLATMEWCMGVWPSKRVSPLEADDLVGTLATDEKWAPGIEKVIVSEDKDLDTVPGIHWNPRAPERGTYTVTQEEASYNHMMQTLCGDSADGYKGCPGVGPVAAAKILRENKLDMWAGVVKAFQEKGMSEDEALVQARIAHILTSEYCDIEKGAVRYWSPSGRGDAKRAAPAPGPVRRLARAKARST